MATVRRFVGFLTQRTQNQVSVFSRVGRIVPKLIFKIYGGWDRLISLKGFFLLPFAPPRLNMHGGHTH